MSEPRVLRLNLRRKWWELIRDGEKSHEFRLFTPYWKARLHGRKYDEVHVCLGYPALGDGSRTLRRMFIDAKLRKVKSEEFGPGEKMVYAIDVSQPIE